jgi:hypothetical protein
VSPGSDNGAGVIKVGGTITIGTDNTEVLSEDEVIVGLPGNIRGGSARVVSTSKRIICSAVVVDETYSNDMVCTAGGGVGPPVLGCTFDNECDTTLGSGDGVCTAKGNPGGIAFPLKVISKKQRGD